MSIMEKVFKYEETDLPIIKYKDEIWFCGKTVVEILGYAIQRKAIREHVNPEDRVRLAELRGASEFRGSKTDHIRYRGSKMEQITRKTQSILTSPVYTV